MRTPDVAVIDYGLGNLLSVRRGLEQCGANVTVTSDPEVILAASRVVLPGVGAFAGGMAELSRDGLDEVTRAVARRGTPLLGICLGMQMLLDESDEFGITPGLGLIPGRVIQVPPVAANGSPQKIPHIGWSPLRIPEGSERGSWEGTVLGDVAPGESVYFVHTFMSNPEASTHRIADALYGGQQVSAVIARDNVHGCQFHPEKSGNVGLKVLRRFLEL